MRQRLLVTAVAIAALAGSCVAYSSSNTSNPRRANTPPQTVPSVQTMVIAPRPVELTQTGLGTVKAWKTAIITPQVSGRVMEVPFHEGRTVEAGDVLVRIDPRPFQAALDQANAKMVQDEATLVSLEKNLSRNETLLTGGGYATQQTVDNERAQVEAQKAAIAGDRAAVEAAQLNLDYATIKSPFAGVIGLRNVDVGNIVTTSTNIATLTEIEPVAVDFTLPQVDLSLVQAAGPNPAVRAFDQSGKKLLSQGQLDAVNNQVDPTSGTIKLKARFDNKDHKLWPGLFVQVQIVTKTEPAAIALPSEAVQRGPNGVYVWVVKANETARLQPIRIEAIQGSDTIMASGLAVGDHVVVTGQYRLADGTHVTEAAAPLIAQAGSVQQ
ncbi:efflux RND transporter periplasmic adaptor subunit [Bradyrhizobium sp. CW7]|uniref:efflux RND transporter periplasmic adaptor subunit n=1 Tax=Bradyrhizobium sp. CW7 TaxID=2782688 RepID=UPI001FF8A993|nr:efflux RND transporter periplasmic adaptor subunit [Bradyrhizobium sp. CW7]MCK1351392.1 efflux RND transporter periplasmic adaptor subunit [Bradyrhizobium sp. CW7]